MLLSTNRASSSVLMGRAKDEAPHLLEWISYHKLIGFDDIVIFSNESTDLTAELLNKLASAGVIHHSVCILAEGETPDREMNYRLIQYTKKLPHEWAALLDIDEYLVLKKHNSVNEFLAEFDQADSVAINWRTFGSSGLLERDGRLTIERFNKCGPVSWEMNRWVKSFGRLDKITGGGPHYFHLNSESGARYHASGKKFTHYADPNAIDATVASINHYAVRSKREYLSKKMRGDALLSINSPEKLNRYNDHYFNSRDNNEEYDFTIATQVEATKRKMSELAEIAGLKEILEAVQETSNAKK